MRPGIASLAYTPREVLRLGIGDDGLTLAHGAEKVIPYAEIQALAVISFHWGNPVETQLLIFRHGQPRPWHAACTAIDFHGLDVGEGDRFEIGPVLRASDPDGHDRWTPPARR